jgi:hypothetical protein
MPTHPYTQMATEPDLAGAGSRIKGRPASRPGGLLMGRCYHTLDAFPVLGTASNPVTGGAGNNDAG